MRPLLDFSQHCVAPNCTLLAAVTTQSFAPIEIQCESQAYDARTQYNLFELYRFFSIKKVRGFLRGK
jgi:hypothetical protein